ncbi:MAG: hypothetical protein WA194_08120, partial [Patescibacteria group bacterium]
KHLIDPVDGYQFAPAEAPVAEMTQDQAVVQDSQDAPQDSQSSDMTSDTGTSDEIPASLNSAPAESTGSTDSSSDEDLSKLLEGL